MKLLDTIFLIHYWAGKDAVADYLSQNEDENEFVTTVINIKEIATGRKLQGACDREEILTTFGWIRILPFRVEDAFLAGELEADLHQDSDVNQDKINSLAGDLLLGAVAKRTGATVVTENTADFEQLDGVDVESY